MNVLILTEEAWNDKIYPNNVMTNWFSGFNGTLANVYLASGEPDNTCCSRYFQITDGMALKSLVSKKGTGKWFITKNYGTAKNSNSGQEGGEHSLKGDKIRGYKVIKKVLGGPLRLCRDGLWLKSSFKGSLFMDFLEDFKTEVIFSLRFYSRKMLFMERFLHSVTGAPVIVFTGDDEYTLRQLSVSPFYWSRKLLFRKDLRETAPIYTRYLTLSERQARQMEEEFGVSAGVLRKGSSFEHYVEKPVSNPISNPIKIVYAGRLYCNRKKTLAAIAKAIAKINRKEVLMTLEIYTKDKPSKKERKQLQDGRGVFLRGYASAEELKEIYRAADIALIAESFDIKNRLLTKYSFSTKVVDCLASSCAVLAVGPYENEGIRYLKQRKAAICIRTPRNIYPVLSHLTEHPDKIEVYRRRAWILGKREHQESKIRKSLEEIFRAVINA